MTKSEEYELLAETVNECIENNKYITRIGLSKKLGLHRDKLDRLNERGLIKNYPLPLSRSAAATLGRKKRKLGKQFHLPNSPRFI